MYCGHGIMDSTQYWDIEDYIFKHFKLKEDSNTYATINPTGYEEFYLHNREILKNADIIAYIKQLIKKKDIPLPENFLQLPYSYMEEHYKKTFTEDSTDLHIVIGFLFLKYQLTIPPLLKIDILNELNKKLKGYIDYFNKVDCNSKDWYEKNIYHLEKFKTCIENEDGDGLTNIGSILPKRTLYV
jgi:hypothetical protein